MQHAKKYGDKGILKALFLPATFLQDLGAYPILLSKNVVSIPLTYFYFGSYRKVISPSFMAD